MECIWVRNSPISESDLWSTTANVLPEAHFGLLQSNADASNRIMKKLAALNINFDSLRTIAAVTAPGFRSFENDPCFYSILDRFLELANSYKLPLTAYLVGQDMEI